MALGWLGHGSTAALSAALASPAISLLKHPWPAADDATAPQLRRVAALNQGDVGARAEIPRATSDATHLPVTSAQGIVPMVAVAASGPAAAAAVMPQRLLAVAAIATPMTNVSAQAGTPASTATATAARKLQLSLMPAARPAGSTVDTPAVGINEAVASGPSEALQAAWEANAALMIARQRKAPGKLAQQSMPQEGHLLADDISVSDAAAGAATSDGVDNLLPETTELRDGQQGAAGMGAAIDDSDQNNGMPATRAQEGHQGGGHLAWLASEVIRFTQQGANFCNCFVVHCV